MQIKFYTIATIAACVATLVQASPIAKQGGNDVVTTPDPLDTTIQQIKNSPAVQSTIDYLIRVIIEAVQSSAVPSATTPAKDPTANNGAAPAPVKDTNANAGTSVAPNAPLKDDTTNTAAPTPAPAKEAAANPNIGGQPIVGKTAPLVSGTTEAAKTDGAAEKNEESKTEEPKKDTETPAKVEAEEP